MKGRSKQWWNTSTADLLMMNASRSKDLHPAINRDVGVEHDLDNHARPKSPMMWHRHTSPNTEPNGNPIDEAVSKHTKMYGPTLRCPLRASACREAYLEGQKSRRSLGTCNLENDLATNIARSCLFTYHWFINKVQQCCTSNVDKPSTRPCANLWCNNTAIDEPCTKHP